MVPSFQDLQDTQEKDSSPDISIEKNRSQEVLVWSVQDILQPGPQLPGDEPKGFHVRSPVCSQFEKRTMQTPKDQTRKEKPREKRKSLKNSIFTDSSRTQVKARLKAPAGLNRSIFISVPSEGP